MGIDARLDGLGGVLGDEREPSLPGHPPQVETHCDSPERTDSGSSNKDQMPEWVRQFLRGGGHALRVYNRHEITVDPLPDQPVLFVANHGFGGVFDLNVLALFAAVERTGDRRRIIMLTHRMAWALGVGALLEPFGARQAGRDVALQAFAEDSHVVVFPGGDVDAFKPWRNRNDIVFGGRCGFADLAREADVPVVPVVTSGGGESAIVLGDGARLARFLRLDKAFRLKRLPVTLTAPWGISVGAAGLLPYMPLPTKLRTAVLPQVSMVADEGSDAFAERIRVVMQSELDRQTRHRLPILG
ncbi:1-acyl-sn-glycerol-3-phosphate acyltransferase [Nocardia sp. NPDC059240]|uniref:1-acyl-sn-glycerol-3-phosphate acyltransferase n=1 Tax=Nocardia sp. NPDC059240 TaxID=3346786 RepID=UPI003688EF14